MHNLNAKNDDEMSRKVVRRKAKPAYQEVVWMINEALFSNSQTDDGGGLGGWVCIRMYTLCVHVQLVMWFVLFKVTDFTQTAFQDSRIHLCDC